MILSIAEQRRRKVKLLIDDADIKEIKRLYEYYPIDGVTTNPTILSKTGREPYVVLHEIRDFIGKDGDLHVQVVAADAEGIVRDAVRIVSELGKETYIKIPAVKEGFKAMKVLKAEGFRLTGTAVYTPLQAYISAKCGCDYIAPYVNRIDNLGYDGVETVKKIENILENNGYETGILAASFKNSMQVLSLCEYGITAATCAPTVIDAFVRSSELDAAVSAFTRDFELLAGNGTTMSNLES